MHILSTLVFLLALIVAGEVIRSTLVANGGKILAALAGEAPALAARAGGPNLAEPSIVPFPEAPARRVVNPPLALPLAA